MRPITYRLRGHTPVPEPDSIKWARWFDRATTERVVAQDDVGGLRVSTVFLGIDYDFTGEQEPLTFETMVFPDGSHRTRRYATWDQAAAGHAEVVAELEAQ